MGRKGYGGGFDVRAEPGWDGFGSGAAFRARPAAKGLQPSRADNWGERGGVRTYTPREAYARDSDYRRWRAGMEIHFQSGGNWADSSLGLIARLKTGPTNNFIPLIVRALPGKQSPESAWHVSLRPRGAILLALPLLESRITLERSDSDTDQHRLVYDVRGVIDRPRLPVWTSFIGDQFEDSASGPRYPDDVSAPAMDAVALTLVAVDLAKQRLLFDLSRPFIRRQAGPRSYWKQGRYVPAAPLIWKLDGSRHLASSHRFECSCPDYQGRSLADLQSSSASLSDRFPTPAAGRQVENSFEAQDQGFAKKWRDLDVRSDRRRECKHIHAFRWAAGVPFDEPDDAAIFASTGWGETAQVTPGLDFAGVSRFYGQSLLSLELLMLGLAPLLGLSLDVTGELRGGAPTFRPVNQPILWSDPSEPPYPWCRQNDWWVPRGTADAWLFDPPSGGFVRVLDGLAVLQRLPTPGGKLDIPLPAQPERYLRGRLGAVGRLLLSLSAKRELRGQVVGYGGLGRSRLVMETNLQLALGGSGQLAVAVLFAAPVSVLDGRLGGSGGAGLGPLSATATHLLSSSLSGAGGMATSALGVATLRLLGAGLAGQGSLGTPLLGVPAVRLRLVVGLVGRGGLGATALNNSASLLVLVGNLTGAGGMRLEMRSGPGSDYFSDWWTQNYGTEEIGLIDWWGA